MSILDASTQQTAPIPSRESAFTLLGIALAAMLCWVMTPVLYQHITGRPPVTTQPATSPVEFSPRDLGAVGVLMTVSGITVLILGNLLYRTHPFERLGLTFTRMRAAFLRQGWLATILIVPAMYGVMFLTEQVFQAIHYAHPQEHDLLQAMGHDPTPFTRVSLIVSAVLLAPVFEEFLFRGMLQPSIELYLESAGATQKGIVRWTAIIVSSLIFTAIHMQFWMMPPIFFLSLCLGYSYARTRNLWVTMMVHALFNASSVVFFLSSR
jgi:membrane protease YdiL (CAAX protease family)